jgi:hypothetical protein
LLSSEDQDENASSDKNEDDDVADDDANHLEYQPRNEEKPLTFDATDEEASVGQTHYRSENDRSDFDASASSVKVKAASRLYH